MPSNEPENIVISNYLKGNGLTTFIVAWPSIEIRSIYIIEKKVKEFVTTHHVNLNSPTKSLYIVVYFVTFLDIICQRKGHYLHPSDQR